MRLERWSGPHVPFGDCARPFARSRKLSNNKNKIKNCFYRRGIPVLLQHVFFLTFEIGGNRLPTRSDHLYLGLTNFGYGIAAGHAHSLANPARNDSGPVYLPTDLHAVLSGIAQIHSTEQGQGNRGSKRSEICLQAS